MCLSRLLVAVCTALPMAAAAFASNDHEDKRLRGQKPHFNENSVELQSVTSHTLSDKLPLRGSTSRQAFALAATTVLLFAIVYCFKSLLSNKNKIDNGVLERNLAEGEDMCSVGILHSC